MKRIWKRLFVTMAVTFISFSLTIMIANTTVLKGFYIWYEKNLLAGGAKQVVNLDLSDKDAAERKLESIEITFNTKIAIYEDDVLIYYSTARRNGSFGGKSGFDVDVFDNVIWRGNYVIEDYSKDKNGGEFFIVNTDTTDDYIVYSITKGNRQVQVMVEMSLIDNSAAVAGLFCLMITVVCLLVSLIWSVYYARRFARPISEMNKIAVDMANLKFTRKVEVDSNDEIGQLATSINNLSDSLDSTMTELQEKNLRLENEIEQERKLDAMRKGFVANVSHELKTPISIIQGYAEGLRDGMAEDKQSRDKYVDVILDESQRMYDLVINLLELSKAEGGFKVEVTDFDLAAVVLRAVDVLSNKFEEKQVSVDFALPERFQVKGDEMLIEQAVRNYISNAASHVEQNGSIKIYTEPYGDNVRLCVFNSGSDIEEEEMKDIWEPFYRSDVSHNRNQGRFGLGLSIVKAIMISHKNDFGVFSHDSGVTFWFEIKK